VSHPTEFAAGNVAVAAVEDDDNLQLALASFEDLNMSHDDDGVDGDEDVEGVVAA